MTTVANCANIGEALRIRIALESQGIDVFVPDETTATLVPFQFSTKSGVRVQVADENAEEARRILAESDPLAED
ncbi:MAG: DUF2007 domain-containing protein [Verrucomicrobiales bacterium]